LLQQDVKNVMWKSQHMLILTWVNCSASEVKRFLDKMNWISIS